MAFLLHGLGHGWVGGQLGPEGDFISRGVDGVEGQCVRVHKCLAVLRNSLQAMHTDISGRPVHKMSLRKCSVYVLFVFNASPSLPQA